MNLVLDEVIEYSTCSPTYLGRCRVRIFSAAERPPVIIVTGFKECRAWIQAHRGRIATLIWRRLDRPNKYYYIEHAPYLPGQPLMQVVFSTGGDDQFEEYPYWPVNVVELLGDAVPADVLEVHEKCASHAVSPI